MSELVAIPVPMPPPSTQGVGGLFRDLVALTKFRITFVAAFTGFTGIAAYDFIHGTRHAGEPWVVLPTLLALCLAGGAANTLNQVFERKRDGVMKRTRDRRPLAAGRLPVWVAVVFAGLQLAVSLVLFAAISHGWLAPGLAAFMVAYYSFFYTLYLKPRHWLNIVVGGVPGSMGPLMAWAAVGGDMSWEGVVLFAIIFLWTPPHVWALAIKLREDYARVGIPMLPVVKGVDETSRQIFLYTVVLVLGTLLLPIATGFWPLWEKAPVYGTLASVLGGVFLVWTWLVWKRRPMPATMPLFHFSNAYIMLLFIGIIVDSLRGSR